MTKTTIKVKYRFLDEVYCIADGEKTILVVTDIQVKADSTYAYGCLAADGSTKWFKEYEINSLDSNSNKIGFQLTIC